MQRRQNAVESFADALTQFAEQNPKQQLFPIIRHVGAPVSVAVRGRDGVGRATVAAALSSAGVAVTRENADVNVAVVAEALKPEDRQLIDVSDLVILNKADLSGFGGGGPLVLAHRRAAQYRASTGVPVVPMVALLACPNLDDELTGALRVLVHTPGDLTSTDAFVEAEHPLPRRLRRRLIDALDRFGIAHAVLGLGDGVDVAALHPLLRRLSLVDRVVEHIDAAGARTRYRRLRSAIIELRTVAAQSDDQALSEFLASDATVLAAMAAAADVIQADGGQVALPIDSAAESAEARRAHLHRALYWRRYSRGPVNDLHRRCASDISRGSLRLLGCSR